MKIGHFMCSIHFSVVRIYTYFEQTHVEEELEYRVDWDVEVDVHGHPSGAHVLPLLQGVNLLTSNHSENEEHIRGQGHDLGGSKRGGKLLYNAKHINTT